jgi:hypothetical protein
MVMKMLNRKRGSGPNPNSGGGGAMTIGRSLPSAGAMTRLSPAGGVRAGSRKKAVTQRVMGRRHQPGQPASAKPATLTSPAIAIKGQPARWMPPPLRL